MTRDSTQEICHWGVSRVADEKCVIHALDGSAQTPLEADDPRNSNHCLQNVTMAHRCCPCVFCKRNKILHPDYVFNKFPKRKEK